ncbi:hypothetical protein [Paenibacillus sp. YAF4_2]|uniref:hypothetical protein n=1 Tax=Paenibacillus sp. YAF4_2 TaxID=3233085 RepID=UPI003F96F127
MSTTWKKGLTLMAASVMLTGVMAGCSSNNNGGSNTEESSNGGNAATTNTKNEGASNEATKAPAEPITYTMNTTDRS